MVANQEHFPRIERRGRLSASPSDYSFPPALLSSQVTGLAHPADFVKAYQTAQRHSSGHLSAKAQRSLKLDEDGLIRHWLVYSARLTSLLLKISIFSSVVNHHVQSLSHETTNLSRFMRCQLSRGDNQHADYLSMTGNAVVSSRCFNAIRLWVTDWLASLVP